MIENMPSSLGLMSFSAYQPALNMAKLPKTAVFFGYKSIKSSWLNTEAKVGSKIAVKLEACVFRLVSTSTHFFWAEDWNSYPFPTKQLNYYYL